MIGKRFVNKGKDIFQYGEWWCSANGEHCADVIATALNMIIDENERLKSKNRGLQSELQIFKEDVTHSNLQINKLADENKQLKHNNQMLSMKMSEVYTKYRLLKEFSEDTNPNDAVKRVLSELMQRTKEYR